MDQKELIASAVTLAVAEFKVIPPSPAAYNTAEGRRELLQTLVEEYYLWLQEVVKVKKLTKKPTNAALKKALSLNEYDIGKAAHSLGLTKSQFGVLAKEAGFEKYFKLLSLLNKFEWDGAAVMSALGCISRHALRLTLESNGLYEEYQRRNGRGQNGKQCTGSGDAPTCGPSSKK